jgi:hypothetical protein
MTNIFMTLNERIIDFLDGSLPADDEAELLHTLSVSPEKRNMLRGFMQQGALFTRDAKSLSVPYAAEQRLWARMDQVLPITATEDAGTAIVPLPSPNAGFFTRAFSGASAVIGAFLLLAGIGIGYFAGHSQTASGLATNIVPQVSTSVSNSPDLASSNGSDEAQASYAAHETNVVNRAASHFALALPIAAQQKSASLVPPPPVSSDAITVPITPVAIVSAPAIITPADIGGDGVGIKPMLHYIRTSREENPSLLSRFEFRFDESFGRQFPNSNATTVSQPILTNLSFTTFFQVFPHSDLLWAGLSGGSANIAHRDLFFNASQEALASDTNSTQTAYGAALAELRLPAFENTDMTFTAGYGLATLGQMMFGEIGLHYDLSSEAGLQCGLRALRFNYNLSAEKSAAIAAAGTSLANPNGIATANSSINAELNAGLFFHF